MDPFRCCFTSRLYPFQSPFEISRFLERNEAQARDKPSSLVLKDLDEVLSEKERELEELNGYHANLAEAYNERVELL